jgi:acyl carrier protein
MKLLGKSGIPARELLHVYFDVKRTFEITIPEDDVANGRFDTFSHIADIITEQTANQTA